MDDARRLLALKDIEELVRPSVSSACRVSSGSLEGSLDHAVSLISITIRTTWSPRVSSQSQPRASPSGRACLPRFALIVQATTLDYEMLATPSFRAFGARSPV